jgi:hypothetical protein
MKRIVYRFAVGFFIFAIGCNAVWAQATAQISGTVRDQTGAVLPGAEVAATQTETGIARNTISNETGSYVLPNLPVGPYRLEVSLPGFRTFVQSGIVLQVNTNPVINAVLEVGQVSEQVEVQANAAMVETRSSGIGQVIENERILELPLNGRNVNDLIVLAGAAVQTGTTSNRSFAGSPIVNVAGGLGFAAGYSLDGALHIDPYNGQSLPLPFPDALQEFKVETSGLSAQSGRGTAVGAVTKSGTNQLHGDAFEFVRNDLFNARSYFATTHSTLKRHQFGGTLGGPIMTNKLFFFGGYQGTTLRQDAADTRSFVPTAEILAGNWTAFTSPNCNAGRQITLRAPFVNNRIDPALYNRPAMNIVSKLPKSSDPCGEIRYGNRNVEDDWQTVGKMDYQWTDKHSVFGRYMATHAKIPHPHEFAPDNLLSVAGRGFNNLAQSYALGDVYLISPNTVNAFRLAVNRVAVARHGAKYFDTRDVGVNAFSYLDDVLVVNVSGGFGLAGGTQVDSSFRTTTYQTSDDINLVRGNHQIAFGANLAHSRSNSNSYSISTPNFSFNGQDTGLGMGDFLLGRLSSFTVGGPNALYMRQWYTAMYGQDTWKISSKLTLNYGLRWEPFLPSVSSNGRVYNFDYERFRQGIRSTVFRNAPAGFYYPGDPGFPGKSGINKQWMNLAPRAGFAWDVNGDGRMSVRASYGLAYSYLPLQWRIDAGRAAPWGAETTVASPPGGFENPWQGFPGGDPFPLRFDVNAPFAPYGSYETTPYDINTTYVSSWNLSVQRQLGAEWLLSTTYMGSQAIHMWVQRALNPAVFLPGTSCVINGTPWSPCSSTTNTNQRRRFTLEKPQEFVGILDEFDDGGTQSYNGLLLSLQRRAARGVTVSGNYTLSHCIGDNADANGMGPSAGASFQDPNNRDFDRGNCDADRRHIFNLTAVAETPSFANPTVKMIASGWRLSGIYRKSSGNYLTITTGIDRALTGIGNQRPNQILGEPYNDKSASPLTNYLNLAAFQQPTLGTLGNMGRNNVRGPGTWQFDLSLSREFQIRESQKLEFRAEAYNFTNSFRPMNPAVAINGNTFGQIRNSYDPRIMQFALKYVF